MREIKFRAWDKEFSQMIHNLGGDILGLALNGKYPNLEIMQYTGLKDKGGKWIYEGDIFKAKSVNNSKEQLCYSVKWNDSYCRFMAWHEHFKCCYFLYNFSGYLIPIKIADTELELDTRSIEIIGNIYENPDLIDTEDK